MEKKIRFSKKLICFMLFVCIAFVFSGAMLSILPKHSKNVQADVINLDKPICNDYIFDDEVNSESIENYNNNITVGSDENLPNYYCLRDDYIIYSQDQSQNGFCWAFTCSTVLSTTLMKASNQYYDFSEAWVGLATAQKMPGYVYGSGGNDYYFTSTINVFGMTLESDFQYEKSYLVNSENKQDFYNYYSQFANKEIMNGLKYIGFKSQDLSSIKSHILNNGAVSISLYWNGAVGDNTGLIIDTSNNYVYKAPSSKIEGDKSGHAITVIGWDDNFIKTYNGKEYKGAWICLNSWGDTVGSSANFDAVTYVFYDDTDIYPYQSMGGFYYDYSNTTDLFLSNSVVEGYTYTTNLKNKYSSKKQTTSGETKQKNVFFDDDVKLTYSYDVRENGIIDQDGDIDYVNIFHGQEDVTYKFNITIDKTNNKYSLSANDLPVGTYKILVDYSNGDKTKKGKRLNVFYVMNGTELGYVDLLRQNNNVNNDNGEDLLFTTYNYTEPSITISTSKESGCVEFFYYPTLYSSITGKNSSYVYFDGLSSNNRSQIQTITITGTNKKTLIIDVNINYTKDSSEYQTNFFFDLDGGKFVDETSENAKEKYISRLLVFNQSDFSGQSGAILPIPKKAGYRFAGWYYDNSFGDNSKIKSNTQNTRYFFESGKIKLVTSGGRYAQNYYRYHLLNSHIAFVYAKWTFIEPNDVEIFTLSNKTEFITNEQFEMNYKINHELSNLIKLKSIRWYENGVECGNTFKNIQKKNKSGEYVYYVNIIVTLYNKDYSITSNSLTINVLNPIADIDIKFNEDCFSWNDKGFEDYTIKIYYEGNANSLYRDVISNTSFTFMEEFEKLNTSVKKSGKYYITIQGHKKLITTNGSIYYTTEEKASPHIEVFEISFNTKASSSIPSKFVTSSTTIDTLETPSKPGYTFEGWYDENNTKIENISNANSNLSLTAKYSLNDITLTTSQEVNKVYDVENSTISVSASHKSDLTNFTYQWYKKVNDKNTELKGATSSSYNVKNVKDSGEYYCKVTLTDSEGNTTTKESDIINVNISKYDGLKINVSKIETKDTYNGNEKIYNKGAEVVRNDGKNDELLKNLKLTYLIKETNTQSVINAGTYTLIIKTDGGDNYEPVESEVQIVVDKAEAEFTCEPIQFLKYTGEAVKKEDLNFTYNGVGQTLILEFYNSDGRISEAVDSGEYDVKIIASESDNYKEKAQNIHITINPANIRIRANDVTSVLFAKAKKLTFTIVEGQIYNNDNLNIKLTTNEKINTNKLGNYIISIDKWDNKNYKVAIEEGRYVVTGWPYYLGAALVVFAVWIIIKLLSRRRYQYDFETNGGSIVSPIDTKNKDAIVFETPTKQGYKFVGWYSDPELTKKASSKLVKSKGKTLYAKWEKVDGEMTLSEELRNAKEIVEEIQEKTNPKKEKTLEPEQQEVVEKKEEAKPISEGEKFEEIIESVDKSKQSYTTKEIEEFINKIVDRK